MSTQPLFSAMHHSSWRPNTLGYSALAHNADSYDDTSEDESGSDVESSSGSEGYMTPSESSELETCLILDLTFELFPEIYNFLSPPAATHLGRIIQSLAMTQSLQWATGCSWDDIYKIVAPQFLARQSVEHVQNPTRTRLESSGNKLRLMAEVLAMLARRSSEHSVRACSGGSRTTVHPN
ncbi:hypothetical protein CPB85DRAFT_391401 [Mucidula mucida]|nr:hypothetical protein CPB85DRAFT_391401 [Mucidula mucida]